MRQGRSMARLGRGRRATPSGGSRIDEALERFRRCSIGTDAAGELPGVGGWQFRRVRFDDEGADGLRDRRLGRVSPRRSGAAEIGRMGGLYPDRVRISRSSFSTAC